MVRPPLSRLEHARGERLGMLLREARGPRSMAEIAAASGVPIETLRKIETGRIATPAFFTVAALVAALAMALDDVVRQSSDPRSDGRTRPLARGRRPRPAPPSLAPPSRAAGARPSRLPRRPNGPRWRRAS